MPLFHREFFGRRRTKGDRHVSPLSLASAFDAFLPDASPSHGEIGGRAAEGVEGPPADQAERVHQKGDAAWSDNQRPAQDRPAWVQACKAHHHRDQARQGREHSSRRAFQGLRGVRRPGPDRAGEDDALAPRALAAADRRDHRCAAAGRHHQSLRCAARTLRARPIPSGSDHHAALGCAAGRPGRHRLEAPARAIVDRGAGRLSGRGARCPALRSTCRLLDHGRRYRCAARRRTACAPRSATTSRRRLRPRAPRAD